MKVIFIKDLKKQGKVNDVKEVSDGYAINYLIKNGYAVKYTKTSSDILNRDIENKRIKEQEDIKKAIELRDKLNKVTLKFSVKCNNGKVFGSISSKQIHDELSKLGFNVDKRCIKINGSISSIGVHIVNLNLHKKVVGELRVQLVEE